MKILGREPALWLSGLSSVLGLAVSFGAHLTPEQTGGIVAFVSVALGAVTAFATRPIAPVVFTILIVAGADLLSAFHFQVSSGTVGAVNAAVLALFLLVRGQVSPVVTGADA